MTSPPERDQLFISYSHVDRGWVERLQIRYLTPAYYNKAVSDSQTAAMDIAGDLNGVSSEIQSSIIKYSAAGMFAMPLPPEPDYRQAIGIVKTAVSRSRNFVSIY